jgi:hemoglobin
MKNDILCTADIEIFVTEFYGLLAKDTIVKDIFFDRLGQQDWTPHLQVIITFWESIIFGTHAYKGQSFLPHASMNLTQIHFDRWLLLLQQSIDNNFNGVNADTIKTKANLMAILFMSKINYYKDSNNTPLI